MSNQIYSNAQNKYFSQPGLNRYALAAQTAVGSGVTTGGLNFSTIVHEDFPGMMVLTNTTFAVGAPGMYCIMINLDVLNATTPSTIAQNYNANLVLNRPGQFNINLLSRSVSMPTPETPFNKSINMVTVVYLTPADILSVVVTNNAASSSLTIFATTSTLIVNRVY